VDDKRYSCEHVVPIEQEPRHHLVIENEFVRAFAVEIAPHDRTLCHHHPHDYLLYVVGDGDIVSAARDEEPKKLNYRDGECELLQAGMVHVVENLGDTAFRNVVVELLPGTGSLRRGDDPKVIAGEGDAIQTFEETRVTQLFDDDRAAIFSIQIQPGAEVEILGPAVVATPYENKLSPDALDGIEIKSNPICHLAWIPAQQEAILWGCWQETERVIIFQVGRTDERGVPVLKVRDPVRSLRAHADESE
jgi:quercetin dioxygenase-like cupin family protein